MSRIKVDAFVLSNSPSSRAYFAYSNQISRDLIISYSAVPSGKDILGKWISAVVRDANSVREPITIIEDLFETRIMNNIPEMKVEAFYDGRYENKFNVFYNKYAGLIFDNANVFPNIEKNRPYTIWIARLPEPRTHARWRISAKQSHSENLRTVIAIVHSLTLDGKRYVAWSKSEPRDRILIDVDSSSTSSFLGKWIEVIIDCRNSVVGPIIIIPDVFETRKRYGCTEVLAEFEDTDDNSAMFYSSYFGNIYNPNQMISQPERNSWYRGWLVFFYKLQVDTRWRLSRDQVIEGPFAIESNLNQDYHNDRRNSWDANDERPTRNQTFGSREMKDYCDFNNRDRNPSSSNFLSPPTANSSQNRNDSSKNTRKSYNDSRHSYESDRRSGRRNIPEDYSSNRNRPDNRETSNCESSRPHSPSSQGTSSNMNQRNRSENDSIHHVRNPENASKDAVVAESASASSSTKLSRISKRDRTAEETHLLKLQNDLARISHLVQSLTKDCSVTEVMKKVNNNGYEELMKLITSK